MCSKWQARHDGNSIRGMPVCRSCGQSLQPLQWLLMAIDPQIFPLSIRNLTWRHALRLAVPNGSVANNLTGPTKGCLWRMVSGNHRVVPMKRPRSKDIFYTFHLRRDLEGYANPGFLEGKMLRIRSHEFHEKPFNQKSLVTLVLTFFSFEVRQVKVTGFEVFFLFLELFPVTPPPLFHKLYNTIQHNTIDNIIYQHHPRGSEWLIRDVDPTSFRVQTAPELEDDGRFHAGFDHSNMFTICLKTLNRPSVFTYIYPPSLHPKTKRNEGFFQP